MPLIEVVLNEYKKLPGAPGKSLNVSVSGIGAVSYTHLTLPTILLV